MTEELPVYGRQKNGVQIGEVPSLHNICVLILNFTPIPALNIKNSKKMQRGCYILSFTTTALVTMPCLYLLAISTSEMIFILVIIILCYSRCVFLGGVGSSLSGHLKV